MLTVTNNSDIVAEFVVQLDDPTIGWIRIEPDRKNLYPGSKDVYRILVQPPRTSQVRAGLKHLGLTISSAGIPGGRATASIQVEVLPFEAIEPRIVPRTSTAFFRGRHRIEVTNSGSAPWSAAITATDPEEALRISSPPQVVVGAGDVATVRVSVQARRWNIVGTTLGHPFTVELDPGTSAKLRLDAVHNQRAVIPSRLMLPLLAALALVAASALWAFGVIPPGGDDPTPPVLTPSPSASPPSPTPSVTPTITPTPTLTPTPTVTPTPTLTPTPTSSTGLEKPDNVDDWAWAKYLEMQKLRIPFEAGAPVGGTLDTDDGRARVQWFDHAAIYLLAGEQEPVVVRAPILGLYPLTAPSTERAGTGYPIGGRQAERDTGRVSQEFEDVWIVCVDEFTCYFLPPDVYALWRRQIGLLGNPNKEGLFNDPYTYYLFDNGRIVFAPDRERPELIACDNRGVVIEATIPITDCFGFMQFP